MKRLTDIKILVIILFLTFSGIQPVTAHPNASIHIREMYSVLPFKADANGNAVRENREIYDWLKLITSDLIDNYKGEPLQEFGNRSFYDYAREEFDFHCKHRLLFHWGFNSVPWSKSLEDRIAKCPWYPDNEKLTRFKNALVVEQARRNRLANASTEELFHFASGGTEAAWANGILAIVYDVHLLGDWDPADNSDFDGVTEPSVIVADIINALRRIDSSLSPSLEKQIKALSKKESNPNSLAVKTISLLKKNLPSFILSSNSGSLKRRFIQLGFILK